MVAKKITSLQHPIVKEMVKIRTNKQFRYEKQQVIISGKQLLQELRPHIKTLFLSHEIEDESPFDVDPTFIVTAEILHKITGMPSSDGYAALLDFPKKSSLQGKKRVLILDHISDPGNLGTLLRTALAFQWDGVILTPNSVDPFNNKALRAAKGATFSLPLFFMTEEQIIQWIQTHHFTGFLADLKGINIDKVLPINAPYFLILSHETRGPSSWTQKICQKITIPIAKMESLNVAIAGAILLYEMQKE